MTLDRSEDAAAAEPRTVEKPEPSTDSDRSEDSGWMFALRALHSRVLNTLNGDSVARCPKLETVPEEPVEPEKPKYRTYGPDEEVPAEEKAYQLRRRRAKKAGHFRINKQILQSETLEELLDVIAEALNWFNIVNIGTALYKLASLALADQSQASKNKAFLRKDNRYLGFLDEVANVMSYVDEPIAIEAANGSGKLIRDVKSACFTPKELANIVWAVTHIGLPHRRLYKLVARHMIWYIDHFDSVNLSLALWGFAKMDVCSPELFHAAAPVIINMIETFEPHRLCNTAWAFSKTLNARENEKLFSAIASASMRKIDKFNLSNESMLVYSFALAQYKEPVELIGMILKQQIRAIKRGEVNDPRSFANMAWGAAELGVGAKYQDLYTAIADYLARRPRILNDFGINQLATLCLVLMMVESKAPQIRVLFDHVRDICATKQMDSTMRTDLMNLQAAFNYYRIDSGCVREALQELLKMEIQQKQERERLIAEQQQQAALMARQKLILGRFTSLSQAIREILIPLVGALLVLFITRRLKLWLLSQ